MTYDDIKIKYLIEYDKADITSSYPSQTDYEIATILDKAYLALIAQKLTGNNTRRVQFEADNKAIEDIRPLIVSTALNKETTHPGVIAVSNQLVYKVPTTFLYYVDSNIAVKDTVQNVDLVNHENATKFKVTYTNKPWIKTPVCYMEGDYINVLVDPDIFSKTGKLNLTYIKNPVKFIRTVENNEVLFGSQKFELTDNMAEELINLAIIMSTQIVEDSRLTSKLQTRPLES